jgi:hypothetical protein
VCSRFGKHIDIIVGIQFYGQKTALGTINAWRHKDNAQDGKMAARELTSEA